MKIGKIIILSIFFIIFSSFVFAESDEGVKLVRVGSEGAVVIEINNVVETIHSGVTELVEGIEITNLETFYDPNRPDGSAATLKIISTSFLNVGDDDEGVKLVRVGSEGAVVIEVDGWSETVASGAKELIKGLEVTNLETFYDPNLQSNSAATLKIISTSFLNVEKGDDNECLNIKMVWTNGREDSYNYLNDLCSGYRCLNGKEISPSCYNAEQCEESCSGSCIDIEEQKRICAGETEAIEKESVTVYLSHQVSTVFNGQSLTLQLKELSDISGAYTITVNGRDFYSYRLSNDVLVASKVVIHGHSYSEGEKVTFYLLESDQFLGCGETGEVGDEACEVCGNNIINGDEICDGSTKDCSAFMDGWIGTASCKNDCTGFETSTCSPQSKESVTVYLTHQVSTSFNGKDLTLQLRELNENSGGYVITVNGRDFDSGRLSNNVLVEDTVIIHGYTYNDEMIGFYFLESDRLLEDGPIECVTDQDCIFSGKCSEGLECNCSDNECFAGIIGDVPPKVENKCAQGCLDDSDNCIPIGIRTENQFCDIDKELKFQYEEEESCNNNYECSSNVCVNSQCISSGFLEKIIAWFSRIFG